MSISVCHGACCPVLFFFLVRNGFHHVQTGDRYVEVTPDDRVLPQRPTETPAKVRLSDTMKNLHNNL